MAINVPVRCYGTSVFASEFYGDFGGDLYGCGFSGQARVKPFTFQPQSSSGRAPLNVDGWIGIDWEESAWTR